MPYFSVFAICVQRYCFSMKYQKYFQFLLCFIFIFRCILFLIFAVFHF